MTHKPAASSRHPRAALRAARNVLWLVVVAGALVKASDEGSSPPHARGDSNTAAAEAMSEAYYSDVVVTIHHPKNGAEGISAPFAPIINVAVSGYVRFTVLESHVSN